MILAVLRTPVGWFLRHRWRSIALLVGAALTILSAFLVGTNEAVKKCEEQEQQPKPANERRVLTRWHVVSGHCVWNFMETNDKPLIVLATLGLVIVTAGLTLYTARLWGTTHSLVEGAEATAQRQLRAYVLVERVYLETSLGQPAFPELSAYGVDAKNYGVTPAYKARMWYSGVVADVDESKVAFETPVFSTKASTLAIGRGGGISVTARPRTLTAEERADIVAKTRTYYIFGRIDYEDAFGRQRFTNFRHRRYEDSHGVHGCAEGNDSD